MNGETPLTWLSWMLRHLPPPLLRALDAWSRRVALQRAARRRERDTAGRKPAAPLHAS